MQSHSASLINRVSALLQPQAARQNKSTCQLAKNCIKENCGKPPIEYLPGRLNLHLESTRPKARRHIHQTSKLCTSSNLTTDVSETSVLGMNEEPKPFFWIKGSDLTSHIFHQAATTRTRKLCENTLFSFAKTAFSFEVVSGRHPVLEANLKSMAVSGVQLISADMKFT